MRSSGSSKSSSLVSGRSGDQSSSREWGAARRRTPNIDLVAPTAESPDADDAHL